MVIWLQAAYVDGLQGAVLYDFMFSEDSDGDRIALLPGVKEMLDRLESTREREGRGKGGRVCVLATG